ncbi:hypothetical protein ES288_A02G057800v1 [Gossypium darwinii]|uniref:Uncharacterized protein n=1 Tax=Gossypium darwinii TaxID=34276 RepID=A0A5D2HAH8_GOSDA|nr:hypothetical protein ES288_A02G057800v1 [Gossypium darwinii]
MAPSRKSKSVNKKFSYINEVASSKDGDSSAKRSGKRKRKLSDMLGPQWTKEELERFYEAYRKYGKDWKKVATMIRNRSVEMVEALYTMNRAYLSLPEGTASVVGLIAMMTDHYSVMGGSDSEQESNEGMGVSRKPQKRSRGKIRDQPSKSSDKPLPDLLQFPSANSSCLSLLKRRRSESRPRAVGKRTPRVPISFSHDKNKGERYFSPIRQGMKLKVDAVDDDVAHEVALALTEASQRGGSPQVSRTPNRKAETPSSVINSERMNADSETTSAKIHGSEVDEDACELSLGSTEADNADYAKDKNYSRNIEGTGTVEVQQKGKRYYRRKPEIEESVNHLEDTKEACSGTEEGQQLCDFKGKFDCEVEDAKTSRASIKGPRKRSKKVLFEGVEDTAFDALQTLADLSLMMPETADTESSVQHKEEKNEVDKTKLKGNYLVPGAKGSASKTSRHGKHFGHDVRALPEAKEAHPANVGMRKRRQKSSPYKLQIPKDETDADSQLGESPNIEASGEVKNLLSKGKQSNNFVHPKQGKFVRPPEHASSSTDQGRDLNNSAPSTIQVSSVNQVNLPTKIRSKRKTDVRKPAIRKGIKSSDNIVKGKISGPVTLFHDGALDLKDVDCMPLNPMENLPASLSRQNTAIRKFVENYNELKMNGQSKESKMEENIKFMQCDNLENANSPSHTSPSTFSVGNLSQPVKVDSSSPNLQLKIGPTETVYTQQAINSQPSAVSLVQAREADVEALSQLTRALDKKEAIVSELRRMNDEVLENQKGGDNYIKDSDSFKKQYAAVLLQLNEINEQVSSALLCLRQRNTYQGTSSGKPLKPSGKIGEQGSQLSSFDAMHHVQESVSHVAEIVESSRRKARSMVDAALQAMSSLRKGGKNIERIEDAIDFVNNQLSLNEFSAPAPRSAAPVDSVRRHDNLTACSSYPFATSHIPEMKLQNLSDQDELKIPSDLISHCVATLLMIQKCTERQFPPGDVAEVLDSAVTSLKPCCSQNLPIYTEIQKCMGIIRNQILALVPT